MRRKRALIAGVLVGLLAGASASAVAGELVVYNDGSNAVYVTGEDTAPACQVTSPAVFSDPSWVVVSVGGTCVAIDPLDIGY